MKPDPCNIDGAKAAGWVHATVHPGDVLVLRHSGLRAGRWHCRSHHDRIGFAVEAFKTERDVIKYGALAIWNAGSVIRFELYSVEQELGRFGVST